MPPVPYSHYSPTASAYPTVPLPLHFSVRCPPVSALGCARFGFKGAIAQSAKPFAFRELHVGAGAIVVVKGVRPPVPPVVGHGAPVADAERAATPRLVVSAWGPSPSPLFEPPPISVWRATVYSGPGRWWASLDLFLAVIGGHRSCLVLLGVGQPLTPLASGRFVCPNPIDERQLRKNERN